MAHAQAVGVGEGQTEFAPHLAMILDDGVQLSANVLGRHLNPRQQPKGGFLESGLNHEDYLAWQIESKRPNVIMSESGDNVSRKEKPRQAAGTILPRPVDDSGVRGQESGVRSQKCSHL